MRKLLVGLMVAVAVAAVAAPTTVLAIPKADEAPPAQAHAALPWVGLSVAPVNPKRAERLGLGTQDGLIVLRVVAGGPADEAGVQRNDVITSVNGSSLTKVSELVEAVKAAGAGGTIVFKLWRDGKQLTVSLKVGERPAKPQPPAERRGPKAPHLGALLGALGDRLHQLSVTYEDKDGKVVTVALVAGTIRAKTKDSLTLKPNGGGAEVTIAITEGVEVVKGGRKVTLEQVEVGDRGVVVRKNGAVERIIIGPASGSNAAIVPGIREPLERLFSAEDLPDGIQERLRKFQEKELPNLRERLERESGDKAPPGLREHKRHSPEKPGKPNRGRGKGQGQEHTAPQPSSTSGSASIA